MSDIQQLLAQRLAKGEITEQEYDRLLAKLTAQSPVRVPEPVVPVAASPPDIPVVAKPSEVASDLPSIDSSLIDPLRVAEPANVAGPANVVETVNAGETAPVQAPSPGAQTSSPLDLPVLEQAADGLWRRSVFIYLGGVLGLSVLFAITPIGSWFAGQVISVFSVVLTGLEASPAEQPMMLRGLAVLFIALLLYGGARGLFRSIGGRLAGAHTVNQLLAQTPDPQMRSVTTMALAARRSGGWIKFLSSSAGISVAPGAYIRGFVLVWLIVAMTSGSVSFEDSIANSLSSGEGGMAELLIGNTESGLKQLRQASERGNGWASYVLGRLNLTGIFQARDPAEAMKWLELGAKQGNPRAISLLGWLLAISNDVPRDGARARELLTRATQSPATELNLGAALYRLARLHHDGIGGPKDVPKAQELYEKAHAAGDAYAASELMFLARDRKDHDAAMTYAKAAAAAGLSSAQSDLYFASRDGNRGVPQDHQLAFEWALRAARQGHAGAQNAVGVVFDRGIPGVVEKSDPEAVRWFVRAARQGDRLAMRNAGLLMERHSNGNPQATQFAYFWYNLAATKGDEQAKSSRDRLERELPANLLLEAQQTAQSLSAPRPDQMRVSGGGTGFFTDFGTIVTNEHVIGGCARVAVEVGAEKFTDVRVDASSVDLDLAVLSLTLKPGQVAKHASVRFAKGEPPVAEQVTLYGFPLTDILASTGSLSTGTVTALVGVRNDPVRLQMSAPVQPGNSGGAVLDENGRLIGVVQSVLKPIRQGRDTIIPQNVNFAIKASALRKMLTGLGYLVYEADSAARLDAKALGRTAMSVAVKVVCYEDPMESLLK
jgi:TPR repeat protein